jgi:hypothetical protein
VSEAQYEGIAAAEYILTGYAEADDHMREYERTRAASAIRRAAAALCHALVALEHDEAFWRSLADVRGSMAERMSAQSVLHDLDALLGMEREVLERAGMSPEAAAAIEQDVARELERYGRWPDPWSVDRVRESVGSAGRSACIRASFISQESPRAVRKARDVIAGAVVIVANGIAAPPGIKELSVFVGGRMILRFAKPG